MYSKEQLDAAEVAANSIMCDIIQFAQTPDQAINIKEAVRFGLLKDFKQSEEHLIRANLDSHNIDFLMKEILLCCG